MGIDDDITIVGITIGMKVTKTNLTKTKLGMLVKTAVVTRNTILPSNQQANPLILCRRRIVFCQFCNYEQEVELEDPLPKSFTLLSLTPTQYRSRPPLIGSGPQGLQAGRSA